MKNLIYPLFVLVLLLFAMTNHPLKAQKQSDQTFKSTKNDWSLLMQDPDAKFRDVQHAFYKWWEVRSEQFEKEREKYGENDEGEEGEEEFEGVGYQVFKRWEYINEDRVQPDGKLQQPGYVVREYEKYVQSEGIIMSAAGNWNNVGPTSYFINNTSQPTGMGRINAIAFHPTDPNTIYIGSPSGGIWKTTNNGTSWTNLCNNMPTLGVSSIVIHPVNPDIIYIGSGDRDAGDALPMGVFKSTDGGATWTQSNLGMGNAVVGAMSMDPNDVNTLIAATSLGIYKTTNGGANWSLKQAGNFKDLHYHPESWTGIVYAIRITTPSKFYKSNDYGETWTQITSGIPTSGIGSRMVMGVSTISGDKVYLLQIKSADGTLANILVSTDAGDNFTTVATGPNIMGYNCDGSGTASQATYDLCMTVDPTDDNIVYVGGINNWASFDGGISWTIITHWVGSDYGVTCAASAHADQHCFAWNPLNGRLYVGNDGGIYYTEDYGNTWSQITNGLPITQIYKIGQGAGNAGYALFGCQDNGSAATTNGSAFYTTRGGDGTECIIDYNNSNYCYNTYVNGDISRSKTGPTGSYSNIGSTGTNGIDENGAWVIPYFLDNSDPNSMFAGYSNVWRTDNVRASSSSSVTWTKVSTGETDLCRVLAQSPVDHNIVYVVRSDAYNENPTLERTDNAGTTPGSVTWVNCTVPGDGHTPTDIKCHPSDPDIVFATVGYGVYKSEDKGMTWTDISSNLPALFTNSLVIDRNANEGIYVGNQTGVWYKNATMTNWALFSTGLPPVDIRELEIYYDANPSNNRIKAGTYGRGLWQSDLAEINVLDPENFTAAPAGPDQIDLAWTKNGSGDDVLVAWAPTTVFGTPVDGNSYSAGNSIPSGGTVVYKGPLTAFSHTSLSPSTTYYYKIWSVNGSNQYSAGLPIISATTDCSKITSFPYTDTFDDPSCWRTKDNTGNGNWQFGSTTNATNPPTILTGNYAYFRSSTGTTVNYDADLISPSFDFSGLSSVMLQFSQHFDTDPTWTSIATLSYTLDNGATWVTLATYTTDQSNAVTVFPLAFLAGQSNVKFKWNYYDDGIGSYMWGIDDILIRDNSNFWTGTVSTDWFVNGNWGTGSAPTNMDAVIIPSAPSNQPLIGLPGAVCLDITINPDASLTMSSGTSYTLSVGGDWINNGTFNRGIGTVEFNGTNPLQTVKGSSATAFYVLKVAKGAQDRILEVTSLITLNAPADPLNLTSGTFKLSSASTITPFTVATSADLTSLKAIWNNGGTINYGSMTWYINAGILKITAGTVNIGIASGNSVIYMNGGKLIIEGGALNIAGRFCPNSGTSYGTFQQSGGIMTVNINGSTSTSRAPFEINSGATYNVTGGTLVIQRASSNTNGDFINASTLATVTGGTLQLGNASTPASQTFKVNTTVPICNLTVNATNSPGVQLLTNNLAVQYNLTISGGTLNANNLNITVGGNWSNSGTFTAGSGLVTFNGTANQNLGGSNATTFNNLTVDNAAGITLNGSVNTTVGGALTLTSGILTTGSNKVIIPSTGTISRTSGHINGGLQKNFSASNLTNEFEIGDADPANYTPVTVTFSGISTAGDLTARTVTGDHPQIASSNLKPNLSVNRYWTLTNSGIGFTDYDALFNFLSSDVDPAANTADLNCGKFNSPVWTYPTVVTRTSTSTQITDVTSFSDFALAQTCTAPEMTTCPANAVRCPDLPGGSTYTVSGTEFDAVASDNCGSVTLTNDYNDLATLAGESLPAGPTYITWTAEDAGGNTASCKDTVFIGAPALTISTVNNACKNALIDVPVTVASFSNVGAASLVITFDPSKLVFSGFTKNAALWGNFEVTNPAPHGGNLDTIFAAGFSEAGGTGITLPDNATAFTLQFTTVGCIENTGINWVLTDNPDPGQEQDVVCQCWPYSLGFALPFCDEPKTSYYFSGSVSRDHTAPSITCPQAFNAGINDGCTYVGAIGSATATDNCSSSGNIEITNNAPASFGLGQTIVTWTAKDECNNINTCNQTVTITDDELPTITCTGDQSVSIDCQTDFYIVPDNRYDPVSFNDNCGSAAISGYLLTGATIAGGLGASSLEGAAINPGVTTVTWYVTDNSNNTGSCSFTITVLNDAKYVVSGVLSYYNTANTKLVGVSVSLENGNGTYNAITGAGGAYTFPEICGGEYQLIISKNTPFGNINSTDAAQVNTWASLPYETEKSRFFAGDVAGSGIPESANNKLTAYDAQRIQGYFVSGGTLAFDREKWVFWPAGDKISANPIPAWPSGTMYYDITVDGNETLDILGMVTGDFNRGFVPGAKDQPVNVELLQGETLLSGANVEFGLPVKVTTSMTLSAVSLIMNYPVDLMEVTDVSLKMENGNLDWEAKGGELRIGWNTLQPEQLLTGDILLTISGKTSSLFKQGDEIKFELAPDPLNELAGETFNTIPGAVITMDNIEFSTSSISNPQSAISNLTCRPNPFSGYSKLEYGLAKEGRVTLEITDVLGRRVALLVDSHQIAGDHSVKLDATILQPGVYLATLKLETAEGDFVKTIKLIRD
jgi:hypothetical protein